MSAKTSCCLIIMAKL